MRLFSLLYEPLIDYDADGRLIPLLAQSYERVDPSTLRIVLRRGVAFHDGTELTSRDVKASLDRLGDPRSEVAYASLVTPLKVVPRGSHELDIVCVQPFGGLERSLVQVRIMTAADIADPKRLERRPNGTGPFRFVRRSSNETVLEAFPRYWREGYPRIARVSYRTIVDASARVDALRTGAVDFVVEASPAQIEQFRSDPKFKIPPLDAYSPSQYAYIYRHEGAMRDVRVRQAIALAVDRNAINDSILRGVQPIAYSVLPTRDPFYKPMAPRFDHDPERARALLASAGHGNGLKLRMPTSTLFQFAGEADAAVAEYLKDVGIDVTLDRMDVGAYASAYADYDISLNAFVETTADPDRSFSLYRPPLDEAVYAMHDPRLADLSTQQRYRSGEARVAALDKAAAYGWEQQPMLFLADSVLPEIVAARVNDYAPTPSFGLTGLKAAWV